MGVEVVQLCCSVQREPVLTDLRFEVQQGLAAVLGPEGAGKSTLLSVMATLIEPSAGTVRVDGLDVRKQKPEVRRRIGYLPAGAGPFRNLTVEETMEYLALLQGIDHAPVRNLRIERALERLDLAGCRKRAVRELPRGVARRIALAQASLCQPSTLLLDDPTGGLDPDEQASIRSYLVRLAREFVVIVATERPEDAEVADTVVVLRDGRLRFSGTSEAMVETVRGRVWSLELPAERSPASLNGLQPTGWTRSNGALRCRGVGTPPEGIPASPEEPSVADAYVRLLRTDEELTDGREVAAA